MNNFKLTTPSIFDKDKIIAGVTHRNPDLFPGSGFSISNGQIYSDDEVKHQREYLAVYLATDPAGLKFQKQVHASHIRIIDKNSKEEESDGMITNQKGVILNITIADCCAILVHDPLKDAIGAFHSGWRGTRENIAKKGIDKMKKEYSSNPAELKIYLSPCASGDKYEVGEEVAEFFPDSVKYIGGGKYLLDIPKEVSNQLTEAGCKTENIEISGKCTISDQEYHSYRRDRERSGRMSAVIGMRSQ